MSENMKLWNAVCTTSPDILKKVNQRGGYFAIDAYSQIQKATEQFGPVGVGWGWVIEEFTYPPNDTMVVHIRLWHKDAGKDEGFSVCGQASLYTKGADAKPDADCAKKAVTDAITKGLSYLGFNADVFLGKFDDNKYVEGLKNGKEKPAWKGPLTKTDLKKQFRALSVDLGVENCPDEAALNVILNGYVTVMNQGKSDMPDWHKGAIDAIETRRQSFKPTSMEAG